MPDNNKVYYAFTTKNNGLAKSLRNEATISFNGKSITIPALWDTGATISCISMDVVSKLALVPTGKNIISTPSGKKEVGTYLLDINLPNNVKITDHTVCDSDIGAQGLGMLIGMDIIGMGDFAVSNFNGTTVFSFRLPSKQTTDYVAQIRCENIIGQKHGNGKKKKNGNN